MRLINLLSLLAAFSVSTAAWATTAQDEVDLANNLARQGCYDSAIIFYNKALQYSPGYGPAIAGRAAAAKKMQGANKKAAAAEKLANKKKKKEQDQNKTAPERPVVANITPPVAKKVPKPVPVPKPAVVKPVAVATPKPVAPPKPVASPKPIATAKPEVKPAAVVKPVAATPPAAVSKPLEKPESEPGQTVFAPTTMGYPAATQKPESPVVRPVATLKPEPAAVRPAPAHVSESNVGAVAPPVSSPDRSSNAEAQGGGDDSVPGWLIATAVGTFLLLVVLGAVWLTPSLLASRQLHNRLKNFERSRE